MKDIAKYSRWFVAACLLASAPMFTACDDDDEIVVEVPPFNLDATAVSVVWNESEAVVNFSASENWSATTDASWVQLTPEKGEFGKHRLFMTFEHNDYLSPRQATVTVKCGEGVQNILVTQGGCTDAASVLSVSTSVETGTTDFSAGSLSLSSYTKEIEGNMGMTYDEFIQGIGNDGDIDFYIINDGEWNLASSAGTRCSAWLNADMENVGWKDGTYPDNAIYVETWAEDEEVNIGRGVDIPDNAEFDVEFAYANSDKSRYIIFKVNILCPTYEPVVDVECDGNKAIVNMEIVDAAYAPTLIKFDALADALQAGISLDVEGFVSAVTSDRDTAPVVMYMIDQATDNWDMDSNYTANGIGYWLDDKYLPTGWTGSYPSNTFYIETSEDGIYIGRSNDVPSGSYTLKFVYALRTNVTKYVEIEANIDCF